MSKPDDWFNAVAPKRRQFRIVRQVLPPADDWFESTMPKKVDEEAEREQRHVEHLQEIEDAPF